MLVADVDEEGREMGIGQGTARRRAGHGERQAPERPEGDGRGRRVAFRIVATLLGLWVLVINVFGLAELALVWLPTDTLIELLGDEDPALQDPAYLPRHRSHFLIAGLLSWAVVLSVLVQWRRPARRVASMAFLSAMALTALVVYAFHGTLVEWLLEEWTWVLPVLLLAGALHPARDQLRALPAWDRAQGWLAVAAAVPWAWYGLANARLQLIADGEHAAMEHWGSAAVLAVVIGGGALIGSSYLPGWRLPAGIAAIASIVFGVHSLSFPGSASGLATVWAVAAVAWGVAFAARAIARSRRSRLVTS